MIFITNIWFHKKEKIIEIETNNILMQERVFNLSCTISILRQGSVLYIILIFLIFRYWKINVSQINNILWSSFLFLCKIERGKPRERYFICFSSNSKILFPSLSLSPLLLLIYSSPKIKCIFLPKNILLQDLCYSLSWFILLSFTINSFSFFSSY